MFAGSQRDFPPKPSYGSMSLWFQTDKYPAKFTPYSVNNLSKRRYPGKGKRRSQNSSNVFTFLLVSLLCANIWHRMTTVSLDDACWVTGWPVGRAQSHATWWRRRSRSALSTMVSAGLWYSSHQCLWQCWKSKWHGMVSEWTRHQITLLLHCLELWLISAFLCPRASGGALSPAWAGTLQREDTRQHQSWTRWS